MRARPQGEGFNTLMGMMDAAVAKYLQEKEEHPCKQCGESVPVSEELNERCDNCNESIATGEGYVL